MVSVFIRGSLVPLVTPDEKRGRVLAVESVFIGASNELGAFESGMAAQAFGTSATVIGGGVGDAGGRRDLVVRSSRRCATSTASRSSNAATRPSRSEGHQPGAALLMSSGISPNDVNTDRIAALSTPVTNGVAAQADDVPDPQVARAGAARWSHRQHQLLRVEPADAAPSTTRRTRPAGPRRRRPFEICERVSPLQSPIRQRDRRTGRGADGELGDRLGHLGDVGQRQRRACRGRGCGTCRCGDRGRSRPESPKDPGRSR